MLIAFGIGVEKHIAFQDGVYFHYSLIDTSTQNSHRFQLHFVTFSPKNKTDKICQSGKKGKKA